MKKTPLFTIITITLDNLAGLKKTDKSITNQSFNDYEWLVIDGASNDGSIDYLRNLRSKSRNYKYPFKFTSEQDSGIYDAMNSGIAQANGQYLLFLNAGDELTTPKTLEVISKITTQEPDFIYGDSLEPIKGKNIYKHAKNCDDSRWCMFTHHQAMIYSRKIIRNNHMHYSLRYKIASDYEFTMRFLQKSSKHIYINQPICIFEQGGISQKQAALGRKEQYIIREHLNIVAKPLNLWILIAQSISFRINQLSPTLYRAIKSVISK